MQITTDAVVIKVRVLDEDKILTLLTKEHGVISIYAKTAKSTKSRSQAPLELFSYSNFVLFKNKEKYILDRADSNRIFFGIRSDIEKLALASYLSELCNELVHEGEYSEEILRLLLNTFHFLEKNSRPLLFLKPVFELRLLTMTGYMPNLVSCKSCHIYEDSLVYFCPQNADILCSNCIGSPSFTHIALSASVLTAMRYTLFSSAQKLFAFTIPENSLKEFAYVSELYIKTQLQKNFNSLDFLNQICGYNR